jgi:putative transposase
MNATEQLATAVGTSNACKAIGIPRASFYRRRKPKGPLKQGLPRPKPDRSLSEEEKRAVLAELHSVRFVDKAPGEVYATLFDEGVYLCSARTMYRILAENGEVKERRNQLRHPNYKVPELVATGPNQIWSWDITKLKGPVKWTYYYLYVVIDIFSRKVVGWMVARNESSTLAIQLISESCEKYGIESGMLGIHADRGPSMKSKALALFLADLGITKTHSRPHVSNDNPFSESQFKTLKYRPEFPGRFGSIEDARVFCRFFFNWYNKDHRHSGIAMLTPAVVHHGKAEQFLQARQAVLDGAYASHPERFVRKPPSSPSLPEEVWINQPERCLERSSFYSKFEKNLSQNA